MCVRIASWTVLADAQACRRSYLLAVGGEVTWTGADTPACSAPEAAASGPLHRVIVAATAHSAPAATTRPGCAVIGCTFAFKYVPGTRGG
jgi:hypothetical protein